MNKKADPNLYIVECYRCGHRQTLYIKSFKGYRFGCKNEECLATAKMLSKTTNELRCKTIKLKTGKEIGIVI